MRTAAIFVCLILLLFLCAFTDVKIEWTGGELAIGVGDEYFHNVGWVDGTEIGLRDDGVVVWRKK